MCLQYPAEPSDKSFELTLQTVEGLLEQICWAHSQEFPEHEGQVYCKVWTLCEPLT
jgi:hypothetical protein